MPNPILPTPGSRDISALSYSVLFDISGAIPTIILLNHSSVIHYSNLTWWYVITTPSGTPIHSGSLISPDVSGTPWTALTIPANSWPLPFGNAPCGQVEFSNNAPYIVILYVKDSAGSTYSLQIQQTITRPNGNTVNSCGNFGVANVFIQVNCNTKVVFCNDATNFTYQSQLAAATLNNIWTLVYPQDADGNQPTNGTADDTPYVNFPINYSGSSYVVYLQDYASYDMGNGATIKVQYKAINPQSGTPGLIFSVLCNINFCQLQCQIQTAYEVAKKKCGNVEDPGLNSKLTRANMLMNMATWGVIQPLCGIDVPALIAQIQRLLDLDPNCNCGCTDTGINFTYPIGGIPGPNNGCCPTIVPVNQFGTEAPPADCPNSYFPVIVFAPNGITPIGYAADMETMLTIINSYPAWQTIGEAFNAGNCQVGFYVNAGQTVSVVIVNTNTTGSGTISVNLHNLSSPVGSPLGCPNSFYPATVYNPTNSTIIGEANNSAELLAIINANPAWNAYGFATEVVNCHVVFYPNTGVITIPTVGITSNGSNSGTEGGAVVVPIYIHGSSTLPPGCPGFGPTPTSFYDPTDTINLGSVDTIPNLIVLLNLEPSWLAYGSFVFYTYCQILVFPAPGVVSVPPVHITT